jgi:uncharacterized protein YjdB
MNIAEIKSRTVAGAVAGNVTVTGIKKGDTLIMVQPVNVASAPRTSEFTVTADDTINNTGGTSTATQVLLVMWEAEGGLRALGTFDSTRTGRSNY